LTPGGMRCSCPARAQYERVNARTQFAMISGREQRVLELFNGKNWPDRAGRAGVVILEVVADFIV